LANNLLEGGNVEFVRRLTRTAYVLGAPSLALLLIGCAEQKATAPESGTVLDISDQPAFAATIVNHITLYDNSGKAQHFDESQEVNVNFKGGLGRATAKPRPKSIVSTAAPGGVTPDGVVVAPILALVNGAEADNYDETMVDSVGNVVHLIATGPPGGMPVTDSYAYTNGVLTSWNHSIWTAANGGFVLSYQSLSGYSKDGALKGEIISTITTTGPKPRTFTSRAALGAKVAALSTLDKVACALSPNKAYAAGVRCVGETLKFAGETAAVVGLVGAFAAIPEISAAMTAAEIASGTAATATAGRYFVLGMALWTEGLHGMLNCFGRTGGGTKRPATPATQ
jgi:hypothetical protein